MSYGNIIMWLYEASFLFLQFKHRVTYTINHQSDMIIHTSRDKQLQKGKGQYTIYSVGPIDIKMKGRFPRYLLIMFFSLIFDLSE